MVVVLVVLVAVLAPSGSGRAPAAHAAAADLRPLAPAASLAPAATRAHPVTPAPTAGGGAGRHRAPAAGKGAAGLVPDPEAANSSPAPADVHHASASTPGVAAAVVASGAPSDAQVRRELQQMDQAVKAESQQSAASGSSGPGGSVGGNGTVKPPAGIPAVIARVMAGGNAIATFPYRFGGGHASFVDNAYDCSASVSYALAAGGLIAAPVTSGDLESWGVAGPGRWITVFANPGHTYMYVDGLRFDTSGRSGVFGSRWQNAARSNAGFVARHWPGL